jgi:peptidoglycan hydrolase CwlO-like protein
MRAVLLVPLLLLAACKDEPRFEERYDKAAKEIEARAKAMDADIAESEKTAAATRDLSEPAAPSNAPKSSGE